MGLDMYLYARKADNFEEMEEIMYWRKHPDLHRYMEEIWRERTPSHRSYSFNNIELNLTREDVKNIGFKTIFACLPKNEGGFFFGESDRFYDDGTMTAVHEALRLMDGGWDISYDSSW